MAARDYSSHQRKIINRYYEHIDTIAIQRLGEIVTELYLATDKKKADRLWERAENALGKTNANSAEIRKILTDRDVQRLAELVNQLHTSGGKAERRGGGRGGSR